MSDSGGAQKNTAYGVFVQACWAQHKRQYPDEFIHKEIEEFNKQCSVWWYNLTQQERDKFQEIADRSNAQQATVSQTAQTYTVQTTGNIATTAEVHTQQQGQAANVVQVQAAGSNTGAGGIPTFGSSFAYSDYGIQGTSGQVVNAVVDNGGTVLHYSTNTPAQATAHVQQKPTAKPNQKPMKDPNAPKKPLSAYFLFCQDEREKVKAENPEYSILEVAKELGRRWATIDPGLKTQYEQRYQAAKKVFDQEMPQKKKKDPNAPKQPLSSYFIFSEQERQKIKNDNPNIPLTELGKELGRRWAKIDPALKSKYQAQAETARQKYDVEMAEYRQGRFRHPDPAETAHAQISSNQATSQAPTSSYQAQDTRPQQSLASNGLPTDYSNSLQFKT